MSETGAPSEGALRQTWLAVRPYRHRLWEGFALLVVTNVLDKSIPWLLHEAVDALTALDLSVVRNYALLAIGCAVGMGLTRTWSRVRVFNVGRDVEHDLRNRLLAHLHGLGPSFFSRMTTGEVMSRAINDLTQVRVMVGFGLLNVVNSVLAYAFALAFMLNMSPELTVYAVLPYPLLILASRAVGRAMFTRSQASQEALGELASGVQETLAGIRIVRAFAIEAERHARFEAQNQNALERNMALVMLRGFMWPLLMGIGSLGTLLVLWRGSDMVRAEALSVGELIAFLAYGEALKWPTMGLGYILSVVQRGRASHARIQEILGAVPEVQQRPTAVAPSGPGALEVRHLSFSFGAHKVLDDVSFVAPAGRSTAIIGRTASGKSTLAALLPRLLNTPPGTVFVDGCDVADLELEGLRRAVGYAQQDPFLFSDTITSNIGYRLDDPHSPEATERIREAAAEASILAEIDELPQGFDTLVGERGVQLSGGQKQRIALARALLNEPRVLVMDDPLSAVDAKTEAAILDALERAAKRRTVILITNRVAAAARADHILVIDGGRVVEHGEHEELLRNGGLYAALAQRQRLEQELGAL